MKKFAIVVGLALLVSAPSSAAGIGVGIGTWDTQDADADQGLAVRFGVDVGESADFEVRTTLFDGFAQVGNNALWRLEATPVDFGLAWHFNRGGKAQPFLGGGGSYIFTDAQFDGGATPFASRPRIDDEFGYYAVVGVDVTVSERMGFYGEAMYRSAKLEVTGDGFEFTDFQSDFAGPSGAVGLMLRW